MGTEFMSTEAQLLLVRLGCLREAALRSWITRPDFEVAVAESGTAAHLRLADRQVVLSPERSADEIYEACRAALAAAPGRKGVIGFLDSVLPVVARLAAEFGIPGCSPEVLANLTDKSWARARFAERSVPGPGFRVLDAAVGSRSERERLVAGLAYPLIIKPADSSAGRGVIRADGPESLSAAWDTAAGFTKSGTLLAEEEMHGDEVSVESVTVGGRTSIIAVTEKTTTRGESFVEMGHALPARLEPAVAGEIRRVVPAALAALGYDHGIAHTELILTASGPRIIEVNPRPAGDCILDLLRAATGTDLYGVAADLALGLPVDLDALGSLEFTGGAAIRFLGAEPGIVRRIDGVAEVSRLLDSAVERLVLLSRPGDLLAPVTTNLHRPGYVLTVGRDTAEAVERAERFASMISIETSAQVDGEQRPHRLPSSECWT